ncbi:MAG: LCP family protein [Chloroflexota bacterium]|nr:LCP family protein [Chloroflexota bacterium]
MDFIKRNPIKTVIAFLVVITSCIVAGYLLLTWNRPLGEPLNLSVPTQVVMTMVADTEPPPETRLTKTPFQPGPIFTQVPTITNTPIFTFTPTLTPTPIFTPTPQPVCGGPNYMNILVTGIAAEYSLNGLADAIRVVHIDFRTQKISVLPFPRDLWVEVPISVYGVEPVSVKLNQAYYYGTDVVNYYDGSGGGSGLLAETLQYNFGLPITHYISINQNSFRTIIDSLGGIDVCFSDNIYRKKFEQPVLYLAAGCHHLTGKQAEMVARHRISIGDLGRIQHQSILLKALVANILTPSNIKYLPSVVDNLKGYTTLSLSPANISALLCLAGKIDPQQDIVFAHIPNEMLVLTWRYDQVRGVQTSALTVDNDKMRDLIDEFQRGIWP